MLNDAENTLDVALGIGTKDVKYAYWKIEKGM